MKIPKQVKVGKRKIEIQDVETIKGCRGQVHYDANTIKIAKRSSYLKDKYTPSEKANTFWHELTHVILDDMGCKLSRNEKFVSEFSDRLDQAIKTAKF
jgi:hypothetical protein